MRHAAHRVAPVTTTRCFVLTISDSRNLETDKSGAAIIELLEAADYEVSDRKIVPDDPEQVQSTIRTVLKDTEVRIIITTGGTGISSRDLTYEAIDELLERRLDGFGELFRMLSYQEIGPAAMLSRAIAGTAKKHVIFSLPGSEHAVRLAMQKLVLPELRHIIQEISR